MVWARPTTAAAAAANTADRLANVRSINTQPLQALRARPGDPRTCFVTN